MASGCDHWRYSLTRVVTCGPRGRSLTWHAWSDVRVLWLSCLAAPFNHRCYPQESGNACSRGELLMWGRWAGGPVGRWESGRNAFTTRRGRGGCACVIMQSLECGVRNLGIAEYEEVAECRNEFGLRIVGMGWALPVGGGFPVMIARRRSDLVGQE